MHLKLHLSILSTSVLLACSLFSEQSQSPYFQELLKTARAAHKTSQTQENIREPSLKQTNETEDSVHDPIELELAIIKTSLSAVEQPLALAEATTNLLLKEQNSHLPAYVYNTAMLFCTLENNDNIKAVAEDLDPNLRSYFLVTCANYYVQNSAAPVPDELHKLLVAEQALHNRYLYLLAQHQPEQLPDILSKLDKKTLESFLPNILYAMSAQHTRQALELYKQYGADLSNSYQMQGAIRQLIRALSEEDTELAKQFIEEQINGAHNESMALELICEWASTSPKSALKWINESTYSSEIKTRLTDTLYRNWKRESPRTFASYILTLPHAEFINHEYVILNNWPDSDQAVAASLAQDLIQKHQQFYHNRLDNNPLVSVLKDWINQNPAEASTWILNEASEHYRDTALSVLITKQIRHDYDAAIELYSEIQAPIIRKQTGEQMVTKLADCSPLDGLELLAQIEQEFDIREATKDFFIAWVYQDIDSAIDNFPTNISTEAQAEALYWMGRNYAQIDPDKVTNWLKSLPPEISERSVWFYPKEVANHSPDAVISFLQTHPTLNKHWNAHERFFNIYSDSDLEGAKELLPELNQAGRNAAAYAIANTILKHDRANFDTWFEQLDHKPDQDNARIGFIDTYGAREPERAFGYALDLDLDHGARKDNLSKAIQALADHDHELALERISQEPQLTDEERDFALAYLQEGKKLPHEW